MRFLLATVVLLAILAVGEPASVLATTPETGLSVLSFEQEDLDGDGNPDMATLMASYMDRPYRVVVYDQGHDMKLSDDWRLGTDFVNDQWLFQTETGDQTKLIIRFSHDASGYTAELFDDVNGDGTVSHTVHDTGKVDILESGFPSVRVVAQQPWLSPEGEINHLVHITTYRSVVSIASDSSVNYLPQDGRQGGEHEIVDTDADGIADYDLALAFFDAPKEWTFARTSITIDMSKEPLPAFTGYFLWPYLGQAVPGQWELISRTPETLDLPPILMDWQQGQIRRIINSLPLWGAGDRWLFYSWTPLVKQQTNELEWEQFAHYNFSGSSTPDVILHLIRSGSSETVRSGARVFYPQGAAFSWHHTNLGSLKWDYKLQFAGLHELPSTTVAFKDFALREVPFEDMLWEYTTRQWAYATFVAAESNNSESSEGILEWGNIEGVTTDVTDIQHTTIWGADRAHKAYLLGETDVGPARFYTDIRIGFRGEFGELNGPGQLYFSPIDHKLHLFKARMGMWKLNDTSEIRYGNLDDDPYIDQWTFNHVITGTQPVTITRQLAVADSHLIYSGDDAVVIRRVSVDPSLFETVPPRDRDEWEALGNKLSAQKPEFSPDDFLTMLRQFDGPEIQIEGATAMDYRPTNDGGFRFVLELTPGYRVSGSDLLGLDGLSPGKYIIEKHDGTFIVSELTPPDLEIDLPPSALLQGPTGQFQTNQIVFEVGNNGWQDASDVIVTGEATGENGKRIVFGNKETSIASGAVERVSFDWVPDSPGSHTITVRAVALDVDGEGTLAQAEWADTVSVDSAPSTSFQDGVSAFDLVPVTPLLVFLGSLLFVSGVFVFYWWRVRQTA